MNVERFCSLLLFTLFFQTVIAGPGDLEVKLLNGKKKEMAAGSTSNVLIMLTNHADTLREVQIKLNTPDSSWRQVANYTPTQIEKNSAINKIISIHIPDNIKSGDYSVELLVYDPTMNQPIGRVNIPIYVLPKYEISVDKLKAPGYLFSGDTLSVKFLIQNLSNLEVKVSAKIMNDKNPEIRNFRIPKDSAYIVNVAISVPKSLNNYSQYNVNLSVIILDKPETESSGSYTFDVIPSANEKFDGYNRLPVKISGILVSDNQGVKRDYGSMFDIQGGGLFNETKNRRLEFHLRGPNREGNPILGLNDEYSLSYNSPHTEIMLGDNNYRLSDLTESSRSGRGIGLKYIFGKLSVGSFFHLPRYYPEIKEIFSFFTGYKISDKIHFDAGYLTKINTDNKNISLMTLSGFISPFSWENTEFELATGQQLNLMTKAYRATVNINNSIFSSHVSYTHADPGFPGYISNSSYISSGFTANLVKKVNLSMNYDLNRSNLALDTIYTNAPYSKSLNAFIGYKMSLMNSMNFGVYINSLEDRTPKPLFNYKKYTGRITLLSKFRRITLNIQGEVGKILNLLEISKGDLTDFYNGNFSMKYAHNSSFSMNAFVNYQGGRQYQITGFQRFYYGGSLQVDLKKKTFVSFDYQNNYELKEYYRDRSLLSFQMHEQLNRNHEFQLSANYNLVKNSLNKKELSIQFRYTCTINVPLSKKNDIGSLKGKVINLGVDHVDGILLNLNGNIAMTDKNGNFEFPVVRVGTYILAMDESNVGLNAIAGTQGPYRITIEPGKATQFELTLTRSARIVGRLVIKEDEKNSQKGYYPIKEDIENLIIEAANGTEIFRVLTGREGNFSFDDLRPGEWHIKIYQNGIPQGYQLQNDQFNFNLSAGQEEKLDVIVQKKSREIKLQKKF
jgi:hypothetical protein